MSVKIDEEITQEELHRRWVLEYNLNKNSNIPYLNTLIEDMRKLNIILVPEEKWLRLKKLIENLERQREWDKDKLVKALSEESKIEKSVLEAKIELCDYISKELRKVING